MVSRHWYFNTLYGIAVIKAVTQIVALLKKLLKSELLSYGNKTGNKNKAILEYFKYFWVTKNIISESHKQYPRDVLRKRCSEHIRQSYKRTPMPTCNFNKVASQVEIAIWHGCSPINLIHIFRTSFSKNTFEGLFSEFIRRNIMVFKNLVFLWRIYANDLQWIMTQILSVLPALLFVLHYLPVLEVRERNIQACQWLSEKDKRNRYV